MPKRIPANGRNLLNQKKLRDAAPRRNGQAHIPVVFPANPGRELFREQDWQNIARVLRLSPRETQVARLIVEDLPWKQIARRMGRSINTIGTHAKRIFKKAGVKDQVGLVIKLAWMKWSLSA
jgi:DNA-binding NarL/FixJ family response regulator